MIPISERYVRRLVQRARLQVSSMLIGDSGAILVRVRARDGRERIQQFSGDSRERSRAHDKTLAELIAFGRAKSDSPAAQQRNQREAVSVIGAILARQ